MLRGSDSRPPIRRSTDDSLDRHRLVDEGDSELVDACEVSVGIASLGVSGEARMRDPWSGEDLGIFRGELTRELPFHRAPLLRVSP